MELEKINIGLENQERFQSIDDFSFVEVDKNTEGATRIIVLDEENQEAVIENVKKDLQYKYWWLQDWWKNEGLPKEHFTIEGGKNKYTLYNFNENLSSEQINSLSKGIAFLDNIKESSLIEGYTILIKKSDAINPQSQEPFYGYHIDPSKVIVLYPRALESKPYREIPEVGGLEATIVHEFSHPVYNKMETKFREEWKNFGWQEINTKENKNPERYEEPTNPERCITTYAQFKQAEDFCESVVGLYSGSNKLDNEKKGFLYKNVVSEISQTPEIKITKMEKITLPKVETKINYYTKKSIFQKKIKA